MAKYTGVRIRFLPTSEGGRRLPVCLSKDSPGRYRPHLRIRGGDGEMLGVEFVDGPTEPIPFGQVADATLRFVYEPEVPYQSLVVDAEFDILEGPRVVGEGRVIQRE